MYCSNTESTTPLRHDLKYRIIQDQEQLDEKTSKKKTPKKMGYIFLAFLFFYSLPQDKMYKENHIMQSVFCKQTSDDNDD